SMLEGKVANIADDVQSNMYIDDSSNFNSLVSNDPVIVEHKGKSGYLVQFNMTLIFSTNGLPRIKNKTHGTYRRMLIVPFLASLDSKEVNYNIKDEYIRDKRVLEFVLHEAINMDFKDFSIPTASTQLLVEYKVSNDPVREFVHEDFNQIMESNNLDRIPKRTAFDLFKQFCKDNSYQQMGYNNFTKQFEKLISDEYESKSIKWLHEESILRYDLPADAKHPKKNQVLQGYLKR